MRFNASGKTGDIIDDDNDLFFPAMLAQEYQHFLHARARGQAAGHIVLEHLDDFATLVLGILAAPCFLRPETITPRRLFGAGNARINDGFGLGGKFLFC